MERVTGFARVALSLCVLVGTGCVTQRLSIGRDSDAGTGLECATADDVLALAPRTWCRVPSSHLRDVAATPTPEGNSGVQAVVNAWSGGVYDSTRDRLMVWGGGRLDYSGNEIYAFSLRDLSWSRLTDPSTDVSGDPSTGEYPDGRPRSRETFNHLVYVPPPTDALCALCASARYGETGTDGRDVQCFSIATSTWSRGMDAPVLGEAGAFAAQDMGSGLSWLVGGITVGFMPTLARYDAANDMWTTHALLPDAWQWESRTAAIDPVRHRMVAVGTGRVGVFDLTSPDAPMTELATTGADAAIANTGIGLAYEAIADRFVAWVGGSDVFALDVEAATWSRITPARANGTVPSGPSGTGTYGRFRYAEALNVFVVVSSVDEDVFLYRLSATP
jgi:hypothetical protein